MGVGHLEMHLLCSNEKFSHRHILGRRVIINGLVVDLAMHGHALRIRIHGLALSILYVGAAPLILVTVQLSVQ